jgi:hypothetical protein
LVGYRDRHIIHRNGNLESEVVYNIHERFTDEVSMNRIAGALQQMPFSKRMQCKSSESDPSRHPSKRYLRPSLAPFPCHLEFFCWLQK